MTKEEILAMEAGRKLDGLVAKEIMGIEVEYPFGEGFPYHLAGDRVWPSGEKVWDAINCYSTDISAAWQVVEKMLADGYGVLMIGDAEEWTVVLSGELNYKQEGKTAPEAICKAALIAKYGKGGET